MTREHKQHGSGHLDVERQMGLNSWKVRARLAADRAGCPVPEETRRREMERVTRVRAMDINSRTRRREFLEHPGRYWHQGSRETTQLYARYMTFYQMVLDELTSKAWMARDEGNEAKASWLNGIVDELSIPIPRVPGEGLTKLEAGAAPNWALENVPPMERYENYVLARLLASYIFKWKPADESREDPWAVAFECLDKATKILDPKYDDPTNACRLTIATAEYMVSFGKANPELVLKRLFGQGKLKQDQSYEAYTKALETMEVLEKGKTQWKLAKLLWHKSRDFNWISKLQIADPLSFTTTTEYNRYLYHG